MNLKNPTERASLKTFIHSCILPGQKTPKYIQWLTSRKVHCSATRWQYRTGQQQGSHFLQLASLISTTKLEKRHYQNSLWSCKKQLIIWSWHSAFTTHDSRSQVYRHHRCGCIISHAEGDTCTHFQDGLLHSL